MRFENCLINGCDRNAHRDENGKKGWCSTHYQRWRKHGDPLVVKAQETPAIDWLHKHSTHSGDECLPWPFAIGADGYGRVHTPKTGSLTTASRLMCIFAHGEPPSPRHEAAHKCGKGNEACTNPEHIYWATPTENQGDRVLHATSNRGERQWKAKLTAADVIEIRRLLGSITQTEIAKRFNVDISHISDIKRRKKWAWLD